MPWATSTRCPRCRRVRPGKTRCACSVWAGSRWAEHLAAQGVTKRQWGLQRRAYLNEHPLCQWPGCKAIADDVDHVRELSDGGSVLDWANLQALCAEHHQAKTTAHAKTKRWPGKKTTRAE